MIWRCDALRRIMRVEQKSDSFLQIERPAEVEDIVCVCERENHSMLNGMKDCDKWRWGGTVLKFNRLTYVRES